MNNLYCCKADLGQEKLTYAVLSFVTKIKFSLIDIFSGFSYDIKKLHTAKLLDNRGFFNLSRQIDPIIKGLMTKITSPRHWAFFVASLWVIIWCVYGFSFVWKNNYDALWILGIIAIPSSSIASIFSDNIVSLFTNGSNYRLLIDLFGILIFGILQYFFLGYLFGKGVKWIHTRAQQLR